MVVLLQYYYELEVGVCRGTPAPSRLRRPLTYIKRRRRPIHTQKDVDAAESRYQEFVRWAITRDSEKKADVAESWYQEFVRRAITHDFEKKRQSVTDHRAGPSVVSAVHLWSCGVGFVVFGMLAHAYADDLQVYCHVNVGSEQIMLQRFRDCADSVSRWMSSNRLKLNPSKTELIWFYSGRRQLSFVENEIELFGSRIAPVHTVRDLGVNAW